MPWRLTDVPGGNKNGLRVFSCFSCGGGSSMGYKMSGYQVEGFCEIDPKMARVYQANMKVRHPYVCGIQDFNKMIASDLPVWLRHIDVLDGSPPCSSFSMAGNRDGDWGKKKKFREGQAEQVLDDLFFHFIETARIVQPAVVVAENVKGLMIGDARKYVAEIFLRFDEAGYDVQLFLLNAAKMGVPQRRERTFFVARRRANRLPKLSLSFTEEPVSVEQACSGIDFRGKEISARAQTFWRRVCPGQSFGRATRAGTWFNWMRLNPREPAPTITSSTTASGMTLWDKPQYLSDQAIMRCQSFPDDYNFAGERASYVCGMSVPPLMMNRDRKSVV